jgi:predicted RNase H-like HicB family nuclease
MEKIKFVYYQENDLWVGWLEEYPDYRTQGTTIDELKENLKDIFQDITTGQIPNIRRYGELVVG